MEIGKKFSEKQIDQFVHSLYNSLKTNDITKYVFDFSKTEWISNQGLLLLTGIFKYFIEQGIPFELSFFRRGTSTIDIPKRVAIQLVQLWDVWGLWKIVPPEYHNEILGFTKETIDYLKRIYNINFSKSEIYDDFEITPFVILPKIKDYDDQQIEEELCAFHKLSNATQEIVEYHKCQHPFVNGIFGSIITKELYENFLDHFENSIFKVEKNFAFMSLGLRAKIDTSREKNKAIVLASTLQSNFLEEEISETEEFFKDTNNKFVNRSYITYSFLDFGAGIVQTLKSTFKDKNQSPNDYDSDNAIIKFAFLHNSSRHPLVNPFNNNEIIEFIPRGLYDILCIVQRYGGLLIARSCYGKILYDFSRTDDVNLAFKTFGNPTLYFPGTFLTIYIPPVINIINQSAIKPTFETPSYNKLEKRLINLYEIFNDSERLGKADRYNFLFSETTKLLNNGSRTLNLISLKNIKDLQLLRKFIFFITASYDVNLWNNFVFFNPPSLRFLEEINYEISRLSNVIKKYKIHPLPFIFQTDNEIQVEWIGIFNEVDKNKLKLLLFEELTLVRSDFKEPDNIIGHLNEFDSYGNLQSNFPSIKDIFYTLDFFEVKEVILSSQNIFKEEGYAFLCNDNYYQFEFLEITKMLEDKHLCSMVSKLLYVNAMQKLGYSQVDKLKFIVITSSSQKISKALQEEKLIELENVISLDNYADIQLDVGTSQYDKDTKFILLCDVLATGRTATKLDKLLKEKGFELDCISVIVDTVDVNFEEYQKDYFGIKTLITSILEFPIPKHSKKSKVVKDLIIQGKIIRINPYTNTPIHFSINETNTDRIILSNREFLQLINDADINIGLFIFNNLLHPYFFKTNDIISSIGNEILKIIFSKKRDNLNVLQVDTDDLKIFVPKKSDILNLNFDKFKNEVLNNHRNIEIFELDRHITNDGWKFTHASNYLRSVVAGKSVLILDDGSCTGASLKQMINEVSFLMPKKITLLCIIGRVSDHEREFLTSINSINRHDEEIKIEIYFGTYWHIPTYYLDENPHLKERNWLKELLKQPNLPFEIERVTSEIYQLLEPHDRFQDYKYFIKESNSIPKKEIIRVRNEIGKVIGYRVYRESFEYFDNFMKIYSHSELKEERYKEVELLCAIVAYEPHLFKRIKSILPDVADKLIEFVDAIIFKYKKPLKDAPLTYKWNAREFIHLFFSMNDDYDIYHKLVNKDLLKDMLAYIEINDKRAFIYVLFKTLKYFPIDLNNSNINTDRRFLLVLKKLRDFKQLSGDYSSIVKVFLSFIYTLPKKRSFDTQVDNITKNFERLNDDRHHKTFVIANLGFMLSDLTHKIGNYNIDGMKGFQKSWKVVSMFIEPLLSFQQSYPTFFPEKIWNDINHIRKMHNQLNNAIIKGINDENLHRVNEDLKELQIAYLNADSELFKLLIKPITNNLRELLINKFQETKGFKTYHLIMDDELNPVLNFPEYYLSEVVLDNIFNNFRHADDELIEIEVHCNGSYVNISFKNRMAATNSVGGGNGLSKLTRANLFPNCNFRYKYTMSDGYFNQLIKIKIV